MGVPELFLFGPLSTTGPDPPPTLIVAYKASKFLHSRDAIALLPDPSEIAYKGHIEGRDSIKVEEKARSQ